MVARTGNTIRRAVAAGICLTLAVSPTEAGKWWKSAWRYRCGVTFEKKDKKNPPPPRKLPGADVGVVTFRTGGHMQKDAGDISGATASTYTINPVAYEDAGNYRCVVTNDFGTAASDEAELTVAELPTGAYAIVDTGQVACYSNLDAITCPSEGEAFFGHLAGQAGHHLRIQTVTAAGHQTGAKLDHDALIKLITNLAHSVHPVVTCSIISSEGRADKRALCKACFCVL